MSFFRSLTSARKNPPKKLSNDLPSGITFRKGQYFKKKDGKEILILTKDEKSKTTLTNFLKSDNLK